MAKAVALLVFDIIHLSHVPVSLNPTTCQIMPLYRRAAFMRGVCALNLEAMALMKGGVLPQSGHVAPAVPADQAQLEQGQGAASATAGCAPNEAGQPAGVDGVSGEAGAASQQAQQQLREQLMDKLLQQGPIGNAAAGWAIGAMGLRAPAAALPATIYALPAPTAGMAGSNSDGSTAAAYIMPAAEQPRPLITLAPSQPVPPVPRLPPSVARPAERHSSTGIRPGTAVVVPCSLPSNVPPHIAAATARRGAASPARPATAPPQRQQAASAAHQQKQQRQQQVSRRSLAGQAREGAGLGKAGQPLVVRGAAGPAAGQRS